MGQPIVINEEGKDLSMILAEGEAVKKKVSWYTQWSILLIFVSWFNMKRMIKMVWKGPKRVEKVSKNGAKIMVQKCTQWTTVSIFVHTGLFEQVLSH